MRAFGSIAVVWLILATHTAIDLQRWAARILTRRWLQGLAFFAVLITIMSLADLPISIYGHSVSRAYGISVQGWASWFGDQAKALGISLVFATPLLLLFNWIVRRWPRRFWFGVWLVSLPLMVLALFVSPLLEPVFKQVRTTRRASRGPRGKLETVVARTGTHIPPERMFLMIASTKTNGLNAYVNGIGPPSASLCGIRRQEEFPTTKSSLSWP